MPRERMYSSNAERQAAYRDRLAARLALAESGQLVARLTELETVLAAAVRRAERTEARAARAERDAATARDRYAELLATRPLPSRRRPGLAKSRVQDQLSAALERVAELEVTDAELRAGATTGISASTGDAATSGMNRAARRAAEGDRRRRH
jgi:hypothetical protein